MQCPLRQKIKTSLDLAHGRFLLITLVASSLATFAGCALFLVGAGVTAGVAGAAYVQGDLEAQVDADPPAIARATEAAFDDLGVKKISVTESRLDAKIIGRTANDTRVEVTVTSEGLDGSKVSIRIGTFGDESKSRKVYEAIRKHLQ